MTAKNAIFNLTNDSTKMDEIAALETFAENINGGTYLKSLFSRELVAWAAEMIRNDFSPDIMDNLQAERRRADDYEERARSNGMKLTDDLEKLERENADLKATNERRATYIETLRKDADDRDEYVTSLQRENEILTDQIDQLNAKIRDLKAMIFDLEHK